MQTVKDSAGCKGSPISTISLAAQEAVRKDTGGSPTPVGLGQGGQDQRSGLPGRAACLGDKRRGDMVHDVWLHSIGMWPAAQCQAASPAALVPTGQTPIVAVDMGS